MRKRLTKPVSYTHLDVYKRQEHITMSSDGHGSWSNYAEDGSLLEIGVSGVDALYKELSLIHI